MAVAARGDPGVAGHLFAGPLRAARSDLWIRRPFALRVSGVDPVDYGGQGVPAMPRPMLDLEFGKANEHPRPIGEGLSLSPRSDSPCDSPYNLVCHGSRPQATLHPNWEGPQERRGDRAAITSTTSDRSDDDGKEGHKPRDVAGSIRLLSSDRDSRGEPNRLGLGPTLS